MNKKQRKIAIVLILVIFSFVAGYSFSSQFNRSCYKSIVGVFGKHIYVPMNKPSFPFGKMTLAKNEIRWGSGQRSKYIVTDDDRETCVIELTTNSLPVFNGVTAKKIVFKSLEPGREFELIEATIANSDGDMGKEGKCEWFSYALMKEGGK